MLRRVQLMSAALWMTRLRVDGVKLVERILGKFEFCFGFQPCLRALFDHVYRWRDDCLKANVKTCALTPAAREEIMVAALLLPHARVGLDSPWCGRVEAFDAAPGGHGRDYAYVSPEEVAELSRYSEAKSVHIFLCDEGVN